MKVKDSVFQHIEKGSLSWLPPNDILFFVFYTFFRLHDHLIIYHSACYFSLIIIFIVMHTRNFNIA